MIRGQLKEEHKKILIKLINKEINSLNIINPIIFSGYDLESRIEKLEEIKSILESNT